MLTITRFPHHNHLVIENSIQMNLNAFIPNAYTSVEFHNVSKFIKLPSYKMRQIPVHAKDLVLITNLTDTW